jgi:ABC-type transport system substrate-binding protein
VNRIEWWEYSDEDERERRFRQGDVDYSDILRSHLPADLAHLEQIFPTRLHTAFLVLAPAYPLENRLVRRALVHALDRDAFSRPVQGNSAHGGIIPPGMPSHSPDIGLPYDLKQTRSLLAQAGYPGGQGFPPLSGKVFLGSRAAESLSKNWLDNLGIEINLEYGSGAAWDAEIDKIYSHGWMADYPDPDNFLRQSSIIEFLRSHSWHDPFYQDMVQRAAETPNRAARMDMYRQADRYLVNEQALVVPLDYGEKTMAILTQPWVEGVGTSAMGLVGARYIKINPENQLSTDSLDIT